MHLKQASVERLAALVAAGHVELLEAQAALLRAAGSPKLGSAAHCEIAWQLRDAVAIERRANSLFRPQSTAQIHADIRERAKNSDPPDLWGSYCPLYEPDLLASEPPPRWRRTAR